MRFTRVEVPDIGIFGALEKQGSMGGLSVVSFGGAVNRRVRRPREAQRFRIWLRSF